MRIAALALCFQLIPFSLHARTISVDLTTKPANSSSTAVLDLARGEVHLPFVVDRTEGDGGPSNSLIDEDDSLEMGRGIDGDFKPSTYAAFDSAAGADPAVVTLDTSRTYEFRNFQLDAGVTLRGTGTAPLKIRVQGTAIIDGTIDLSGNDGSFSAVTRAAGGTACCGGKVGGAAGDPLGTTAGAAGGSADGAVGGGAGGAAGNPAGGGGGGGHASSGLTGSTGTVPGATYGDAFVSTLLGGSGGGGGGAHTGNFFGASGGGGGGVLDFHVGGRVTISSSGVIRANGGMGGQAAAGTAGNGGGGSGGALVLFSGGTIENAGTLRAVGGKGAGGGIGAGTGEGSDGRIRYCTFSGDITPIGSGSDSPAPLTSPFGRTYYRSLAGPYTVISGVYDSGNTAPTYLSVTEDKVVPAGSTLTVQIAGSSDGFVSDDTGWKALTDLDALKQKRYYRFRASLSTGDRDETPVLRGLTIEVADREQPVFHFKLASCAGVMAPDEDPLHPLPLTTALTLMGLWLVLTAWAGRRYSSKSTAKYSTPRSTPVDP
jgi:hypothetical protein